MKRLKILYIHGFNGSENGSSAQLVSSELKKQFIPEALIFNAPQFSNDLNQIDLNISKIKAESSEYDLIIASSYGALCTVLSQVSIPCIFINPCLQPSKTFQRLTTISDSLHEKLLCYERLISSCIMDNQYYIFSDNDNLFGENMVKENKHLVLSKLKSKHVSCLSCSSHKIDSQISSSIINVIFKLFPHLYHQVNESEIFYLLGYDTGLTSIDIVEYEFEHFFEEFSIVDSPVKKEKYIDQFIELINIDNEHLEVAASGDLSDELMSQNCFWTVHFTGEKDTVTKEKIIDTVQVYAGKPKKIGKANVIARTSTKAKYKLIDDEKKNHGKYGYYFEVSGEVEYVLLKDYDFPVIPNKEVKRFFSYYNPDLKITLLDDGVHYKRLIGGKEFTKVMLEINLNKILKKDGAQN
jgi:hypothetical protein